MRLGPWLAVLGIRQDYVTSDVVGSPVENTKATTGRAGLMYELPFGLTPYVSYATSFTPVFGSGVCLDGICKAQQGEMVELGFKYNPFAGTAINGAIFDTTEKNRLASDPGGSLFSVQTGKVRIRGAELEVITRVTPDLDLIGAYSYLNAMVESGDNAGKHVETVPEHQASLWAKYRLTALGLQGVTIGGGVRYIGESWDGTDTLRTPDYTLFDAMIRYETGPWRFQVNASNLADKRHVTTCLARGDCFSRSRPHRAGERDVQVLGRDQEKAEAGLYFGFARYVCQKHPRRAVDHSRDALRRWRRLCLKHERQKQRRLAHLHELRGRKLAVVDRKIVRPDMRLQIIGETVDRLLPARSRRSGVRPPASARRSPSRCGSTIRRPAGTATADVGPAEFPQRGFDIARGIEIERDLALFERFVLDDGFEQPVLVGEVDVERALGDAGGARDLVHAGAVKAQIHEHLARAVQNLAALRDCPPRRRDESCLVWLQPLVYLLGKDFNPGYGAEGLFRAMVRTRSNIS